MSDILYMIPGAIIAFTLHEFTKAFVSWKLGDPLPKARFKVTLNPVTHFEPIGFLCMVIFGYGWGKPVDTSSLYYKDRKKGTILTYAAPSVVNLIAGMFFILLNNSLVSLIGHNLLSAPVDSLGGARILIILQICVYMAASLNIATALFNIIPIAPLDGFKILPLFISADKYSKMVRYEKLFTMMLVLAMFLGFVELILGPFQSLFMSMATRLRL